MDRFPPAPISIKLPEVALAASTALLLYSLYSRRIPGPGDKPSAKGPYGDTGWAWLSGAMLTWALGSLFSVGARFSSTPLDQNDTYYVLRSLLNALNSACLLMAADTLQNAGRGFELLKEKGLLKSAGVVSAAVIMVTALIAIATDSTQEDWSVGPPFLLAVFTALIYGSGLAVVFHHRGMTGMALVWFFAIIMQVVYEVIVMRPGSALPMISWLGDQLWSGPPVLTSLDAAFAIGLTAKMLICLCLAAQAVSWLLVDRIEAGDTATSAPLVSSDSGQAQDSEVGQDPRADSALRRVQADEQSTPAALAMQEAPDTIVEGDGLPVGVVSTSPESGTGPATLAPRPRCASAAGTTVPASVTVTGGYDPDVHWKLRQAIGLSPDELAKRMGLKDPKTVHRLEGRDHRGKEWDRALRWLPNLYKSASILGVAVHDVPRVFFSGPKGGAPDTSGPEGTEEAGGD